MKKPATRARSITILANKRVHVPSYPAAVMAQAMMQAAGINAEIEVLEWATQLDRYNKGKYQMQSFSYSARLDPALSYEQFAGPKDKQPRKVWENPKALALLDKAYVGGRRNEACRSSSTNCTSCMMEDTPLILLYNGVGRLGPFEPARRFLHLGEQAAALGSQRRRLTGLPPHLIGGLHASLRDHAHPDGSADPAHRRRCRFSC